MLTIALGVVVPIVIVVIGLELARRLIEGVGEPRRRR